MDLAGITTEIIKGDSLELLLARDDRPDLIVTDPPYAFGGSGAEHELSATVAGEGTTKR